MFTVITKYNKVSKVNPLDIGVVLDDTIIIDELGRIALKKGNPITWPADASDGTQAIVDINKATIRFGVTNGIMQKYEYVVSTYGDSGTVPKPKLKEFISIEDAPPAPHIFDLINYWPEAGAPHPGTKDLPEGWEWKWFGDDWVLSNGVFGLVRDDWFKYNDIQVAGQPVEIGTKADPGKPILGAIPPHAELAVARVLTFGAKKYSRGNWAHVENSDERYMDAALRHLNAHRRGEKTDSETGENHLAHAICCLMFILENSETS